MVSGEIPAGALHRAACARHLDDLAHAAERGFRWQPEKGEACVAFFENVLRHFKGEWAGQTIRLEPWQRFLVYVVLSWVHAESELRRFRNVFVELPRGNGKSTLVSGLALWLTFFDDEPGADSFAIATKRDQAKIVWDAARQMVLASPSLQKKLRNFQASISSKDVMLAQKFVPLGADADTLDGLRPHFVSADEVHRHPTADLINIMQTGMGTRRHPMLFEITTAGVNRTGPWWEHREYSIKVLERAHADDSWFAFIAGADAADDWTLDETHKKANPNYGVSVKPEYMRQECAKAQAMPLYENDFRRLHLGQLVTTAERVLSTDDWRACASPSPIDLHELRRVPCFGGLDLSNRNDITAFVLWWQLEHERFVMVPHFWVPKDNIDKRAKQDRVPYDVWERKGLLTATPGNVIDHRRVRQDIVAVCEQFNVREIGYDPWSATESAVALEDEGLTMVPIRQGYATISEPTKKFVALVQAKQITHDGNAVMEWMIDNLAVSTDPAGNLKPDKAKARERIDGVAAAVTGLARAMLHTNGESVYTRRGIATL